MTELSQKSTMGKNERNYDLICFSHLRWDFVYQRPQHLLSRFACKNRVFFIEEPIFIDGGAARLEISPREDNLVVVTAQLPHGTDRESVKELQTQLLDDLINNY